MWQRDEEGTATSVDKQIDSLALWQYIVMVMEKAQTEKAQNLGPGQVTNEINEGGHELGCCNKRATHTRSKKLSSIPRACRPCYSRKHEALLPYRV